MAQLNGRVALVTGAARVGGIGQGAVRALLDRGAAGVVFSDIDADTGAATQAALVADYGEGRTAFVRQDAASPEDWDIALAATLERFGGLDILVNNAGRSLPGSIATLSIDELRRGMAINFDSQFLGIKICAPALAARAEALEGGAAIVNNSSMAAYLADPSALAYHTSKSASRMLTMCAAREFGPQGIRVNSVHFGATMTPMMRSALDAYVARGDFVDAGAAHAGIAAMSPLGTTGTAEDAGRLIAYLVSAEARYITGAAFWQDGGCFMQY